MKGEVPEIYKIRNVEMFSYSRKITRLLANNISLDNNHDACLSKFHYDCAEHHLNCMFCLWQGISKYNVQAAQLGKIKHCRQKDSSSYQ